MNCLLNNKSNDIRRKKNNFFSISHTLLKVIAPTTAGATKPGIDAKVFVIPTSVPIQ